MRKGQVIVRKEEPARSSTNTVRIVKYLECQRNLAASVREFAMDGCQEFMVSGIEANAAISCAACGFYKNFHKRKEEIEVVCDHTSSSVVGNRN